MITKERISDIDTLYNYNINNTSVGYLEVRLVDGVLDIINVYVNEENRRQGIAKALFNFCFEDQTYSRIMLEVSEKNISAIKLYNSLGFKEISFRERYYNDSGAIIMEKVK